MHKQLHIQLFITLIYKPMIPYTFQIVTRLIVPVPGALYLSDTFLPYISPIHQLYWLRNFYILYANRNRQLFMQKLPDSFKFPATIKGTNEYFPLMPSIKNNALLL